ncbi:MAG: helix-turn-helix transcriptional regulator [Actinomycetota bacterium]|nr:helix-turn-helix transcriptional regulator [Actinomycetota bacterium]
MPDLPLTRREREVLVLLAAGLTDGEVARTLGLSRGTVRVHVSNAMRKLRATDREEALVAAGLALTGGEDLSDATKRRAGP